MNSHLPYIASILLNASGIGLMLWGVDTRVTFLSLLAINIVIIVLSWRKQSAFFRELSIYTNNVEGDVIAGSKAAKHDNVHERVVAALARQEEIIRDFQNAIESIASIGQEAYSSRLAEIKSPLIRSRLSDAHEKSQAFRMKDEQARWLANGLATVAALKNNDNDLARYGDAMIAQLVKYLNASQGSFFILKGASEDPHFELLSAYAYGKKRWIEKRFNPGEGLLGQLYYEKNINYLTDVPADYVKITSGLGEALPRSICLVPLMNEGQIYGAIELASFTPFQPHELEFLERMAATVGSNLAALDNNLRTKTLLEESQKMTSELTAQEEELRLNMEELRATQEDMKRKEKEMDAVLSSVSTVELDLQGCITHVNGVFSSITGYKEKDIVGRPYKSLIPQTGNDPAQYEIMWGNIVEGRSFSGEFRIASVRQGDLWMAGNFTPILDSSGKPRKVMVISLFTTQDKEKLQELQTMVAAFKALFPIADLSPNLQFKSANDLFLRELGIRRIDLRNTSPEKIMSSASVTRLMESGAHNGDPIREIDLEILSGEQPSRTYSCAVVRMNGNIKKNVLIFKNKK